MPKSPAPRPRLYRLVEFPGLPHPSLDGLYESIDEAWTDALSWWQGRGEDPCPLAGAIGVEVSTPAGEWRTLVMRSQGLPSTGG
ncbi:hypothetical protein NZK33_07470 [Cyanobium sp. FGCU-6]|nr:hypothetical protein [Cyanobium sp. FGCU6]